MPLTIPLQRVDRNDSPLVGGKAVNLAVLLRAHLPVPPGFCVTVTASRQFLEAASQRTDWLRIQRQISTVQPDQAACVSEQALACLGQVAVPPAVEQAILTAWRAHGEGRAYAVRSSATVENLANHSFAGQFESFLNVRDRDALIEAVKKCWLSPFSASAHGAPLGSRLRPTRHRYQREREVRINT